MKLFSENVDLPAGIPMGGYANTRDAIHKSSKLEVNGLSFHCPKTQRPWSVLTVDTVFPGDLYTALKNTQGNCLVAASHTHTGPMMDSQKPIIGEFSAAAVQAHIQAVDRADRHDTSVDKCTLYTESLNTPIYRRFDSPPNWLNKRLCRTGAMYPNKRQPIDRNLYIFVFSMGETAKFVFVQHACHPVSRSNINELSSDFVGVIRRAVRTRFGVKTCLFFQGCSGDIRPNFTKKRVPILPKFWLNKKFKNPTTPHDEASLDAEYSRAVLNAVAGREFQLGPDNFYLDTKTLATKAQGDFEIQTLHVNDELSFEFVPFEVSHLFHLEQQNLTPNRFIVSCSQKTVGYLPHPSQIDAGGYEVDGSLRAMGLKARVELSEHNQW